MNSLVLPKATSLADATARQMVFWFLNLSFTHSGKWPENTFRLVHSYSMQQQYSKRVCSCPQVKFVYTHGLVCVCAQLLLCVGMFLCVQLYAGQPFLDCEECGHVVLLPSLFYMGILTSCQVQYITTPHILVNELIDNEQVRH